MRLKTLELQGFKSFPDKTLITFDRGITVVVGPNGSGKSNISDAMRWVLGEISSKNIRGGKMEDVVFAGSQKRSPMNYAEVSVTFDNTEEEGQILSMADYDEIVVTRRYYRVGESEYFINRKPVRLRDIHELFLNTGLGRDGYSIIGQGKIAEIISQKNDERRAIFEEAAGIARYRYQKNEATKKLDATNENLIRLEDIAGVLGERVGPLAKESEKARKYLEIRDAKMAVDIALSLFDIDNTKTCADELSGKLVLSKAELDDADETRASLEASEEKAREDEMQNKIESEKLSARILDLTRTLHENESKISLSENDAEHLRSVIDASDGRIAAECELLTRAVTESDRTKEEYDKVHAEHVAIVKKSGAAAAVVAEREEELAENARLTLGNETRMGELRAAQTDAMVAASVAEAQREAASQKCTELSESIEKHESDIAMLTARIGTAEEKIADYKKKEDGIRAELDRIAAATEENEKRSSALADQKNSLFLDISQRRHKIQNLVRMEELLEGYSGAVRFVINEHKDKKIRLSDGSPVVIYGPVSSLITVPDRYSAALEVAFGQSLQNIVVEDEACAKAAIAYLKKKNAGRATFYPISTMRGGELTAGDIPENAREGFVSAASALVSCDERFRGVIRSLLGRILIAENMDSANRIAKAVGFRYRIVTLDGQVINAGGSFTGGSLSADGRILSRRVQIEKLGEEVKVLEVRLTETEKEIAALAEKLQKTKKEESGILSRASVLKTLHDAEQTQLTVLCSNREAQMDALSLLREEYDAASGKSAREMTDIDSLSRKRTAYEKELTEATATAVRLASEKTVLTEQLDGAKAEAAALSVEIAKGQASLEMLAKMRDSAETRVGEIQATIEELRASAADAEVRIKEGKQEIEALRAKTDTIRGELALCDKEKASLAEDAASIGKRITELRMKSRDITDKRDLLYRTYTKMESEYETLRDRQEKLIAFLWDEYELTYSDASRRCAGRLTEKTRPEAVSAQTKYKNQLRALGSVNVNAIEEYKTVKTQFDELSGQIDDLKTSKEDLLRIIDSLEETMRSDFLMTVEEINANFAQVFAELFGGGRAEIKLSDPEHVLESGIDINVAPPGKVIKNMSLLSGGEQSFVAIALYFAILKVNPTPFCILDEIEAALDEVNVDKFADYVKHYSDKTQFVIITHRRGTMEAAERLYGVTMHEKGISDVISIDVSEIEQKIGVELH